MTLLEGELATVRESADKDEILKKANNIIIVGLEGGEKCNDEVLKVFSKLNFVAGTADYSVHSLRSELQRKPVLVEFATPQLKSDLMEFEAQELQPVIY